MKLAVFLVSLLCIYAFSEEIPLSRYARAENGVLSKEFDLEGGRAYWINGVSIMGLPDAGADIMGFYEPAKRLPMGFSGLYTPHPAYQRYGLSLNSSNGILVFKENYNPIDTPVTELLWERYGLEGNAFKLNFNRLLLDSIVFTLGVASHSVPKSGDFYYQDIVHQLYTGSLKRDSSRVPLAGRNLAYNSFHAVPAVSWIFPNSSITAQASYLFMDNDDATRNLFLRDIPAGTIIFPQSPYNINGFINFYRFLWNYRFLPGWELSASHRFAEQELKFSKLDTASIFFPSESTEKYSAQTGESRVSHKSFLNPYVKIHYEYLRSEPFYQDRQLISLGIDDTLWRFAFKGESGMQRNASALDSTDFAPALHFGATLFLPWHLQFSGDYQKDTRFPSLHETHILRVGRIAFPNSELKAEKRQRMDLNLTYKLSERFFYSAGYRYEFAKNAIMPFWATPKPVFFISLPADTAFKWANAPSVVNNELFWRIAFELGNWSFFAEQGKSFLRTNYMIALPKNYYKGSVIWSNRFVENRLKVTTRFDADWFGERWDYGLESDSVARPMFLRKYLSLNFKSSMQIQEFTLFARIENMNHSLIEPEAGYAPPGIRFAYGIEWQLRD